MAGMDVSSNPLYAKYKKKKPSPVEDMYKVYNAGVERQAGDYDEIMGKYRDIYSKAGQPDTMGGDQGDYDPALATYTKSGDTTAALANYGELIKTGGLSGEEQQNLRARGISPIRAMYASAQRDMDRKRNLGGGYSANYGAVTGRMARDQSSLLSDKMQDVNAGIAEMVQKGKLSAAPGYAQAAQDEAELSHRIELANQQAKNESRQFNATNLLNRNFQRRGDMLGAAQGMTNLYGTTPALANLYGSQAMDQAQFAQNTAQQKRQNSMNMFNSARR